MITCSAEMYDFVWKYVHLKLFIFMGVEIIFKLKIYEKGLSAARQVPGPKDLC